MRIIFEEHQYQATDVQDILHGICALQDVDKMVSVNYVGYFYNTIINDCVFILPKVLLTDRKKNDSDSTPAEYILDGNSKIDPSKIINPDGQNLYLTKEYRKFIYEFSIWIYRALCVYRFNNQDSKAIYYKHLPQEGHGKKHKANTLLDIILSLVRFNKENQDFFLYTIKNIHSGNNKINWTRTIAKNTAYMQTDSPIYIKPTNKKRLINYDEELFIIFFSILNHLNDTYGFRIPTNCYYDLLSKKQFNHYINKSIGTKRLLAIRYKYFSDKAIQLWDLCYAFFDISHQLSINTTQKEYLLAKNFNIVFEAIIDDLIGDPRNKIPLGLKDQIDGKRVDHMYTDLSLTSENDNKNQIYYIGDSKYYKSGHEPGKESIYKQFTYARNVIQWNINLFLDDNDIDEYERNERELDRQEYMNVRLRGNETEDITEGYNVIPNFFISAFVENDRKFDSGNNIRRHTLNQDGEEIPNTYISYQFVNRLFDRDTLILSHYDVNFLYVIYLYAREKQNEKLWWKHHVRKMFRKEIQNVLSNNYNFYAMQAHPNVDAKAYIKNHFQQTLGKIYTPFGDKEIFSLALDKDDPDNNNEDLLSELQKHFFIVENNLGDNPQQKLISASEDFQISEHYEHFSETWLPNYHIERYLKDYFIIGSYHDQAHWDWITGKNDKKSFIYNVRLDKTRNGAQVKNYLRTIKPKFAILYELDHEHENKFHVFRIHDTAEMTEERMQKAMYPRTPQGNYFIFRFDEEITIGDIDITALIKNEVVNNSNFKKGEPIFKTGLDLIKYRKK